MNLLLKQSLMAGLLLSAVGTYADIIVDDFTGGETHNMLVGGGSWIADGDSFLGGTSKVTDLVEGSNLVTGDSFSGDNITKAYTADGSITSNLYVKADVGPTKKWAYAGWVMDFLQPKPVDLITKVYDLKNWEKYQEADISSCESLELTLSFEKDRVLWVDIYNPLIERQNANAPQYGWKYTGTGAVEVKKFALKGITGPAQKWKDDANKEPLNLAISSRIRFLYEGLLKGVATPSYDTLPHTLKIKKVALIGAACIVKENRGISAGAASIGAVSHKSGLSFTAAHGQILFGNLDQVGALAVTVRNMTGQVLVTGKVNGINPSLNTSALKNGVYSVEAVNANLHFAHTLTLLN
jgi:hypothetical protein